MGLRMSSLIIAVLMGLTGTFDVTTPDNEASVGPSEEPSGGEFDGEGPSNGVKVPGATSAITASTTREDSAGAGGGTVAADVAFFMATT